METVQHGGTWWRKHDDGRIEKWVDEATGWQEWTPALGSPPPSFTQPVGSPAAPPAPTPGGGTTDAPKKQGAVGCVGVIVLLLVGAFLWNLCTTGSGGGSGSDVPFSGEVTGFTPVDEANLRFDFRLTNEGSDDAKGECTVKATDASGSTVGFDFFSSTEDVPAGESVRLNGTLRIEDEGAFRVQDVVAEDCGSAE